jgi:hypothetical protein
MRIAARDELSQLFLFVFNLDVEVLYIQRVLKDAPFDKKDAHLVAIAGNCVDCPQTDRAQ